MNVTELKQALKLCFKSQVPAMVWGHHGMGKSSALAQLAKEEGRGFVDFRCAQIEASDLRGWPSREGGRTVYNAPKELPAEADIQSGEIAKEGYIFLDELNRADDPVIQAVFQLIVERKIGAYKLPDGWAVVAAGNYTKGYHVNDFCAAFVGRFCHLQLTRSDDYVQGWAKFMMDRHGDHASRIIQFIGTDLNDVCSRESEQLDFKIEPSPRLWEMLARVEEAKDGFDDEIVSAVRKGLVGVDLATKYERINFSVDPKDVVLKGIGVLEHKKLPADHLAGLTWGVLAYVKSRYMAESEKTGKTKWTIADKECDHVLDYMDWLTEREKESDLAMLLVTQLLRPELKQANVIVISNPHVAKILSESGSIWLRKLSKRTKLFELTKKIREGS